MSEHEAHRPAAPRPKVPIPSAATQQHRIVQLPHLQHPGDGAVAAGSHDPQPVAHGARLVRLLCRVIAAVGTRGQEGLEVAPERLEHLRRPVLAQVKHLHGRAPV